MYLRPTKKWKACDNALIINTTSTRPVHTWYVWSDQCGQKCETWGHIGSGGTQGNSEVRIKVRGEIERERERSDGWEILKQNWIEITWKSVEWSTADSTDKTELTSGFTSRIFRLGAVWLWGGWGCVGRQLARETALWRQATQWNGLLSFCLFEDRNSILT